MSSDIEEEITTEAKMVSSPAFWALTVRVEENISSPSDIGSLDRTGRYQIVLDGPNILVCKLDTSPSSPVFYGVLANYPFHISVVVRDNHSEGQETSAIAPAPENARKKIEGRGLSRP
jgi:hypothetical protein